MDAVTGRYIATDAVGSAELSITATQTAEMTGGYAEKHPTNSETSAEAWWNGNTGDYLDEAVSRNTTEIITYDQASDSLPGYTVDGSQIYIARLVVSTTVRRSYRERGSSN
ncbi:hypothetical protein [Halegenticoccus soli]|uniref:hypothetical protein n=1 Tax=Halegenticoccus soli TaxID=1985678 RepID=UPI000C6ECCA2|nr:hypothetical protein [Halegenticoccus soli]